MVKCKNPWTYYGQVLPCGRCLPCLIQRRRVWTARMVLEAAQFADNAFVTLTYSEESLPRSSGSDMPTLRPEHLQLWLKRFRKQVSPLKVRFYGVGEYGDVSWRPHYHVALFGFPACRVRNHVSQKFTQCACLSCSVVNSTWGLGFTAVGGFSVQAAQYVAGYVTKKMTSRDDLRLQGREPEFARMSRRPGIGVSALHEVASQLMMFNLDTSQTDVPSGLRFGKKILPIGRFMRGRLREMIGQEKETPQHVLDQVAEELLPLQAAAFASKGEEVSLASQVKLINAGYVAQLEYRNSISNSRRHL